MNNMSILSLILEANIIVQLVMLLLCVASVISWWFIFAKSQQIKQLSAAGDEFEHSFWSGGQLGKIYQSIAHQKQQSQGIENVFEVGYREYIRAQQAQLIAQERIVAARRLMDIAKTKQLDMVEKRLAFLATVGSVSPYVGLFGTVIGIMNAFIGLGNAGQATLNMVAPGIAEALIATAIGLVAAIPAVVAYNRFAAQIQRLDTRMQAFIEEFSALMQRQVSQQERS